jgi:hypothetical protein
MDLGCEHWGVRGGVSVRGRGGRDVGGPPEWPRGVSVRGHGGRMPLPTASDSTSPRASESEGSKTSGSDSAVSDSSDPPDMQGMSLLS